MVAWQEHLLDDSCYEYNRRINLGRHVSEEHLGRAPRCWYVQICLQPQAPPASNGESYTGGTVSETEITQAAPQPTPADTVPEKKEAEQVTTAGSVDAGTETVSSVEAGANDVPKGLKIDLFKLRQQRRDDRARIQDLEARLVALDQGRQTNVSQIASASSEGKGLFDDPEAYLAKREADLLKRAETQALAKFRADQEQTRIKSDALEAEKWLLSQKEFKEDPGAVDEIMAMYESDANLLDIASRYPKQAVKLAVGEWRSNKGLPSVGEKKPSETRIVSPKPTGGSAGSGPTVYNVKDVRALAATLDPAKPEDAKKLEELRQALVEGRVRQ